MFWSYISPVTSPFQYITICFEFSFLILDEADPVVMNSKHGLNIQNIRAYSLEHVGKVVQSN